MSNSRLKELESIFLAGVQRVDPKVMIRDRLRCEGDRLTIATEEDNHRFDLGKFDRIVLLGVGKAAAKMAAGALEVVGERIDKGIISVKDAHRETLGGIETVIAGHPLPNAASVEAARRFRAISEEADERTLVLGLISGGGSALLCSPYENVDVSLDLAEKQEVTRLLLASGATIHEVNCVRKHLSGIKGGRLAELSHPATVINLILSDVVGDDLDAVASGLMAPDPTTFDDALQIIGRYEIADRMPKTALRILQAGSVGRIPETPKPGDVAFERVTNVVVGSNAQALAAAKARAEALGYRTTVISSQITGEAREIAHFYLGIGRDIRKRRLLSAAPACIIGGGETTVTLRGSGRGGRNQEMALSALLDMKQQPADTEEVYFLSAGTDGSDGPTDAAGAFASREVLDEALAANLSIDDSLRNNDSYHFFDSIGRLLKTGSTDTNVCDIQVLLVP